MEVIHISADDSCFERARKILAAAGLVDRVGLAERMSEAIEKYRKLDLEEGAKSVLDKK